MSLDATNWAWKARLESSTQRVILLSMSDRAGEDHTCWPSVTRLAKDCCLDRKTVMRGIDQLKNLGFLKDTGKIRGNGVKGREDDEQNRIITSTKSGTSTKITTSTKSGTASSTKSGIGTSTKSGTQNLSIESFNESKNKKDWFSWKKLEFELSYLQDPSMIDEIKKSSWFEREKTAFENFNAETNLSDDMMIYHFADKLVQAVAKYRVLSNPAQNQKSSSEKPSTAKLSEKQIFMFAQKISRLPEYAGKHGQVGESYEDLANRISDRLHDDQGFKSLMPYLKQVGYKQSGRGA